MEALRLRLEQAEKRAERAEERVVRAEKELHSRSCNQNAQIQELRQTIQLLQHQRKDASAENGDATVGAELSGMTSVQASTQQPSVASAVGVGGGDYDLPDEDMDLTIEELMIAVEEASKNLHLRDVGFDELKDTDVLVIKGGKCKHLGNVNYLKSVNVKGECYKNATKARKSEITGRLLLQFRKQGIRFLVDDGGGLQQDIGNRRAFEKVRNALLRAPKTSA